MKYKPYRTVTGTVTYKGTQMDNIYQALKGLCKAIVNLLVAVVDLLAGVINGIAHFIEWIKPKTSVKLKDLGEQKEKLFAKVSKEGKKEQDQKVLVTQIREELAGRISSKEDYYAEYARLQGSDHHSSVIWNMILMAALLVSVVIYTQNPGRNTLIPALLIFAAACAGVCFGVISAQKKEKRNVIALQLLEREFEAFTAATDDATDDEAGDTDKKNVDALNTAVNTVENATANMVENVTGDETKEASDAAEEPSGSIEPLTTPEQNVPEKAADTTTAEIVPFADEA